MTANKFTLAVAVCSLTWCATGDDKLSVQSSTTVAIEVGEVLPAFEALSDAGQTWKSAEHGAGKTVVIYFYPGDFTSGCTRQAQSYRDAIARLEELGIELVGISGDDLATHKLFKEAHGLTHTLLADPDGALAAKLGIPVQRHNRPMKVRTRDSDGKPLLDEQGKSIIVERKVTLPRSTLIIARDGTLVSKRMNVNAAKDAEEVAKIVESLKP